MIYTSKNKLLIFNTLNINKLLHVNILYINMWITYKLKQISQLKGIYQAIEIRNG